MGGAAVKVQRERLIQAPIESVWKWICDPKGLALFRANIFHVDAESDARELRVGSQVRITHALGLRREMRIARIATLRRFEIAWSEVREEGRDWFPHHQRLVLSTAPDGACVLTNTLHGTFRLPGARWWLVSWYRFVLPLVLAAENRRIARADFLA